MQPINKLKLVAITYICITNLILPWYFGPPACILQLSLIWSKNPASPLNSIIIISLALLSQIYRL
jgi:hypothetical protein